MDDNASVHSANSAVSSQYSYPAGGVRNSLNPVKSVSSTSNHSVHTPSALSTSSSLNSSSTFSLFSRPSSTPVTNTHNSTTPSTAGIFRQAVGIIGSAVKTVAAFPVADEFDSKVIVYVFIPVILL
jgi:hypothetical protein